MAYTKTGPDVRRSRLIGFVGPGIYRVREEKAPFDPELERGMLEIYDHPIKGWCFWDQGQDGDSDGHVPIGFLDGETIELVTPNAEV